MKRATGPKHVAPRPAMTARSAYGMSSSPSTAVRLPSPIHAPVRMSSAIVDSHSPSRGISASPVGLVSASNARRAWSVRPTTAIANAAAARHTGAAG